MILKTSVQDDLRDKVERSKVNLEKRFEGVETNDEFGKEPDSEEKDRITRELMIDNVKLMPDKQQRYWLAA